jgi:hypothetical protein
MSRRHNYRTVSVDVEIEDVLDDLSDEEIIEEAKARDLVIVKANAAGGTGGAKGARELVSDIMGHLMCRRKARASEDMMALLAVYVPVEIMDAYKALLEGDDSQAICHLDDVLMPRSAVPLTSVPSRKPA